jgi:hypothetical protein
MIQKMPVAIRNNTKPDAEVIESFVIPEGYMTGDEFARRVIEELTVLYKKHGLI